MGATKANGGDCIQPDDCSMPWLTVNQTKPWMHVGVRFEETMKVKTIRSPLLTFVLVLVAVSGAAANGAKKIKVGKTGAITLKASTDVGIFTLPRGRYLVQHRVVGSDHRIHFTLLKENLSPWARSRSGTIELPDEVSCRLEAMSDKARQTVVFTKQEGNSQRITRIEIKGEDVAHVF
jgi:hypothetical protein